MSETPGYVPPSGDPTTANPPAPPADDPRDARIAQLLAELDAAKNPAPEVAPVAGQVDLGDSDPDSNDPHIVTHSGVRMLLSKYRETEEFLKGFVKGE